VKVLVLGNSDSSGEMMQGSTWPALLREAIEAREAEPVELEEARFSPLGRRGPGYALELVERSSPDLVILPVGTYAFTVGLVKTRLGQLFGPAVESRYSRAERWFDAKTRHRGPAGDRLNRLARRVGRTVIGTSPVSSVEAVTAAYRETFEWMAQAEAVQVVVVTYPPEPGGRRVRRDRARCFEQLRPRATRLHFAWVDGEREVPPRWRGEKTITPDGFHLSAAGHRAMAAAIVAATSSNVSPDRSSSIGRHAR